MKVWHFTGLANQDGFFLANAVDDVTSRNVAVIFEITIGY